MRFLVEDSVFHLYCDCVQLAGARIIGMRVLAGRVVSRYSWSISLHQYRRSSEVEMYSCKPRVCVE